MFALNRKLLRDLWRLRGQVLAIGLVIASGVAVLVMSLTAVEALDDTAVAYYERHRFGHVFAKLERAPDRVAQRIAQLPGVLAVETRVVHPAIVDIEGFEEPVVAELVSVSPDATAPLNQLALRSGRFPVGDRPDEAVLNEPFALAHGLGLGDRFRAVINGRWRELDVVGTALSPEYVYALGPGALVPDDRRFGVIWLGRDGLRAAFDLHGAFNDISVRVHGGTDTRDVVAGMDRLLDRYGSIGAYDRSDQISNWFLMNEIDQLRTMSSILPSIFLAVAAFLTNMVLGRLITVERAEIGLLKAFGYSDLEVGWHYLKLVLCMGSVGVILGWAIGFWLGLYNTQLYAEFYRFPFLLFRPGPNPFVIAAVASLGAAVIGSIGAIRQSQRLSPAEAMQPPAPPLFKRTQFAERGLTGRLDQLTRIVLRQIGRWPVRSFLTSAGIGMAVAVLVTALHWLDAIDHMVDVYFKQAQRQDISVGFAEARPDGAIRSLKKLPGVLATEGIRSVSARLRSGSREHRGSVLGVPAHQTLQLVFDASGHQVNLPPEGLVLSTMLAEILQVQVGDELTVEILEGRRPMLRAPVAGLFETYIGTPAYLDVHALNRLMLEGKLWSGAHLMVDSNEQQRLFRELKHVPQIASLTVKQAAIDTFHETLAETIVIYISFFVAFACTLAFAVSYNATRIAVSERGRELATLRVLGFSRAEISYLLLGEIGLLTFVALPLGCAFGYGLAQLITGNFKTELYRIPLVIDMSTFGWAMLIGLVATALSGLIVRRRLDRLDLVGVLKTRE